MVRAVLCVGIVLLASAAAASAAAPRHCVATTPNGRVPPGISTALYGNGRLVTDAYGVIEATDRTLNPDGTVTEKFPWWGAGVTGQLRIGGERLDRVSDRHVRARISEGADPGAPRGTRFWASSVTFPTLGCWRVTGRVGSVHLSLVVRVRKP